MHQATSSHRQWVLSAIEQFEARLLRYARRYAADEHAARDIVQYSLLKLCDQNQSELDGRLSAWLFTVCRNRAYELNRKEQRMSTLTQEQQAEATSIAPAPDEALELQDTQAQLRAAIESLPEELHEAIDLWSEGLSYREISEVVGRNEGHIRVQVHRAIGKLRQHPDIRAILTA